MYKIIIMTMILTSFSTYAKRVNDHINLEWKEEKGKIKLETVCSNYKKGSINNRECRGYASETFKKRCKKQKSEKFCEANRKFKIIE